MNAPLLVNNQAMKLLSKDPAYRPVTVIALLQSGVILGGTLFKAVVYKAVGMGGYDSDNPWRGELMAVRSHGFLYFLLPVLWVWLAVSIEKNPAWAPLRRPVLLLGIASVLYGLYWYFLRFFAFDFGVGG